jgi:hypothetical protein
MAITTSKFDQGKSRTMGLVARHELLEEGEPAPVVTVPR